MSIVKFDVEIVKNGSNPLSGEGNYLTMFHSFKL